ncbi:uncharacterized protein B0H64DRAFT_134396 [Chaetomium fimeti]|uniref:Prion-inhibition and propagation HeLo domain-containing protein n=1 Tax=Chaetomium fimeti TaxID=1854472 RepID=A0AAE0LUG1_9PEZI|nr:hypothetical protein B0H64DRAFT_134396 [Chaetomium fimeti]
MHHPFGLDFKDASLATIFATCVSCFEYALAGQPAGQAALKLSIARLRLTRWGEAVGIYHDGNLGEPEADPDDLKAVEAALVQLIGRFEVLATTNSNDKSILGSVFNQARRSGQPLGPLLKKLDEIACSRGDRQQNPGLLENTRVLKLGERTDLLVQDSSECADTLEEAFPPNGLRQLSREEMAGITDPRSLHVLRVAASGIDHWISPRAGNAIRIYGEQNLGLQVGQLVGGISGSMRFTLGD